MLMASWLPKELTPIMPECPWFPARDVSWLGLRGTLYKASAISAARFKMMSCLGARDQTASWCGRSEYSLSQPCSPWCRECHWLGMLGIGVPAYLGRGAAQSFRAEAKGLGELEGRREKKKRNGRFLRAQQPKGEGVWTRKEPGSNPPSIWKDPGRTPRSGHLQPLKENQV